MRAREAHLVSKHIGRSFRTIVGLVFAVALPVGSATAQTVFNPGFQHSTIAASLLDPTAMEFSPDGKLYVLEQAGTMKVFEGCGAVPWTQVAFHDNFFAADPLAVHSGGEQGLLGVAFDPEFERNRQLYVYYRAVFMPRFRISRFTADRDGKQVIPASEVVLMVVEQNGIGDHSGGAIHFGPDGKLYAAIGDATVTGYAQSIATLRGKMLRLNPDPLDPIPADNPTTINGIAGTTTGLNRAIWAAGLRNPYTFAFKPGTSIMYINDVGSATWEEVDIGAAGANFGWGITGDGPFDQALHPQLTHPIIYYHHKQWELSVPTAPCFIGRCIAGGVFYQPTTVTFPDEYVGHYFFADFMSGGVWRYDPQNAAVEPFGSFGFGAVDLKVGHDGALYVLSHVAGTVTRVQVTCPADIAPDGAVNVDDLLAVINAWGPCANPSNCPPDIAPAGGNDAVNVDDLLAVINAWGACP